MILPAVAGAVIVAAILWEAFEAIVLPRRVRRRLRFTVMFYRGSWYPWRAIARRIRKKSRREAFLGIYGPLSLLYLLAFWAALIVLGFGLIFLSVSARDPSPMHFPTCLYLSGTTFVTLGLGDVVPQSPLERFLVVIECGIGLGFLALVLSYLPVIYQAFSRREVNIVLLDARAGSPPTAAELLRRHSGPRGLDALQQLLHDWERSAADILESHISYPAVCYFRSQHANESWLGALTAILDTCTLIVSGVDDASCTRQARLTFAMCRHTVVDLSQVFNAAPRRAAHDRLPPADLERLRKVLTEAGFSLLDTPASNAKLAKMREMYEPYLQALSAFFFVQLPPWILAQEAMDNWRTSAWGRIRGFGEPDPPAEPSLDDHSD
ncbi:MAG: potassium channel family protein [Candidatus Acidiferrales bacterium]